MRRLEYLCIKSHQLLSEGCTWLCWIACTSVPPLGWQSRLSNDNKQTLKEMQVLAIGSQVCVCWTGKCKAMLVGHWQTLVQLCYLISGGKILGFIYFLLRNEISYFLLGCMWKNSQILTQKNMSFSLIQRNLPVSSKSNNCLGCWEQYPILSPN